MPTAFPSCRIPLPGRRPHICLHAGVPDDLAGVTRLYSAPIDVAAVKTGQLRQRSFYLLSRGQAPEIRGDLTRSTPGSSGCSEQVLLRHIENELYTSRRQRFGMVWQLRKDDLRKLLDAGTVCAVHGLFTCQTDACRSPAGSHFWQGQNRAGVCSSRMASVCNCTWPVV